MSISHMEGGRLIFVIHAHEPHQQTASNLLQDEPSNLRDHLYGGRCGRGLQKNMECEWSRCLAVSVLQDNGGPVSYGIFMQRTFLSVDKPSISLSEHLVHMVDMHWTTSLSIDSFNI